MKMYVSVFASAAIIAAWASQVLAHGPVIQVGINNGKIVTRSLFVDEPYDTLGAVRRIYQIPLVQRSLGDANDGWYGQLNGINPAAVYLGPGIAYGVGGFATGVTIRESFADGLKLFDGTSLVDPGSAQVQGLRGSITAPSATLATTDVGPFASFAFATTAADTSSSHKQVYWRLLGDGVTSNSSSPDGVYVVTLQVSTTQAGVESSDPFYVLFTKNASQGQIDAATGYVSTLVPEPAASLPLAGVCLLAGGRRRR